MNAYRYLAKVYDSLMSDVDYNNWAQYLHRFLSKAGAKNVLEVSCGTGNITFELSALGYDIIASDLSIEMLKIARESGSCPPDVTFDVRNSSALRSPKKPPG